MPRELLIHCQQPIRVTRKKRQVPAAALVLVGFAQSVWPALRELERLGDPSRTPTTKSEAAESSLEADDDPTFNAKPYRPRPADVFGGRPNLE